MPDWRAVSQDSNTWLSGNLLGTSATLDVPQLSTPMVDSTSRRSIGIRHSWNAKDPDFSAYYERNAGRLLVDPKEAEVEFGKDAAALLKLSADGQYVLWPQPSSDPEDPQNWSDRRKAMQLLIITLAASLPDFIGSIGIATIFALAKEFDATPNQVNALSANWGIFLLGWGGFAAIILVRRWGRLPVLFWSQLLALGFLVGSVFATNLKTFAATRCIASFFSTAPQITGLYTVTDMYPFHLQARKLNLWTLGFIMSPFLSPFFLGFLVAHASYQWAWGIGAILSLIVLVLVVFFGEETAYDRYLPAPPRRQTLGLRYRVETLLGITGIKMTAFRPSWSTCFLSVLKVLWRPHALLIMIFGGIEFGLSIGITITNAIFLGQPRPGGFGLSQTAIAGSYATPIVACLVGEVMGRYGNDKIAAIGIRRNKGVFVAETRLWMCYLSLLLYLTGFIVLGHGVETRNVPAVIMGWGIGQVAIMLNTTALYAYLTDCFPAHLGEVSALFNFFRTISGFAVVYFQAQWLEAAGGFIVFGAEAAIVFGLFLLVVPLVQLKGAAMRAKYPLHPETRQPAANRAETFRLSHDSFRMSLSQRPPAQKTEPIDAVDIPVDKAVLQQSTSSLVESP
ncbi:MFS general substrate transporter [Mycena rebaudengoi]|nr:MFS general substrate transporter [Mycena rebaudengoi]